MEEAIDFEVFVTIALFVALQIACAVAVYKVTMRGAKAEVKSAVDDLEKRLATRHEAIVAEVELPGAAEE